MWVAGEAKHLFNGKDMDGWEHIGPGRFTVEDGMLKTHGGMGLLWYTREKVGNAVLRIVYKASKAEDNSGVFIRISDRPSDPWYAVHHGYEVADSRPSARGHVERPVAYHRRNLFHLSGDGTAFETLRRVEHLGDSARRPAHPRYAQRRKGERL